jgi:hypothetical protein
MANISLALGVFTIWLNPVTASKNVKKAEPAASLTTSAAVRE